MDFKEFFSFSKPCINNPRRSILDILSFSAILILLDCLSCGHSHEVGLSFRSGRLSYVAGQEISNPVSKKSMFGIPSDAIDAAEWRNGVRGD